MRLKKKSEVKRLRSLIIEGNPQIRDLDFVVIDRHGNNSAGLFYQPVAMPSPMLGYKSDFHSLAIILSVAKFFKVSVIEDGELTRSLFESVSVGEFIPRDLYRAVAEILAPVYAAREEGKGPIYRLRKYQEGKGIIR